jgi:uncharacterized protein with PIN domain
MKPRQQLEEVLLRLDLLRSIKPFSRCMCCNHLLESIDKESVLKQLPADTIEYYHEFWTCRECNRIYWAGSHYQRLQAVIDKARTLGAAPPLDPARVRLKIDSPP